MTHYIYMQGDFPASVGFNVFISTSSSCPLWRHKLLILEQSGSRMKQTKVKNPKNLISLFSQKLIDRFGDEYYSCKIGSLHHICTHLCMYIWIFTWIYIIICTWDFLNLQNCNQNKQDRINCSWLLPSAQPFLGSVTVTNEQCSLAVVRIPQVLFKKKKKIHKKTFDVQTAPVLVSHELTHY